MQFTPAGEIEWTRQITIDPNAPVYLKDMEPTPDGGYVLAGYQYSPAPQKSWVLKIDASGNTCEPADCDSTALIDTAAPLPPGNVGRSPFTVKLSPNPAGELTYLTHNLPAQYPRAALELYNAKGALVKIERLHTWQNNIPISLKGLPSGVYVYRVRYGGGVAASGKLVRE